MILANKHTIRLIGFPESTITQEAVFFISQEFSGSLEIISPNDFINSTEKENYSYFVAFTLDNDLRKRVIDIIDSTQLDCIIYIHPTVIKYFNDKQITNCIGAGSFISPYSTMLMGSTLGRHCIVETYCQISHYVNIGNNNHLHCGTMIAGKTLIGNNCTFNFRSTVVNQVTICDNIELGAMSCITKDISKPGKYVGVPARRIGDIVKWLPNE